MLVGHMGVHLRGTDVAVPEHGLYAANVGAVHQQIGCKAVSHGVRTDVLGDAS